MQGKHPKTWTEEEIAEATRLWREGNTAVVVAAAVGKTKGAVIGLMHRRKVVQGTKPDKDPRGGSKPGPRRQRSTKVAARPPKPPKPVAPDAPEEASNVTPLKPTEPPPEGVTILELRHWHCRYPKGEALEPAVYYCGQPKLAGRSYCSGHCAVAFCSPIKRRAA